MAKISANALRAAILDPRAEQILVRPIVAPDLSVCERTDDTGVNHGVGQS